ncbi:MAG TPA: tetratricopeptide repeat protein [Firmicutes bacterium]|nr:tetratricopeptide repeat protein [Candidatus Fermentithermobacillaceae bacterium]
MIQEPKRFSFRHWWNYVTVLLVAAGLGLWAAGLVDGRIVFGALFLWVILGLRVAPEILWEHLGFLDRWVFHDYQKAHLRYRKAASTNKATPQAYCALASLAYAEGDLTEAARLLEEAATRLPGDPYLRFLLSVVLTKQGRYDEALNEAVLTGKLSNEGVLGDMAMGTVLRAKGDIQAAASAYQSASRKAPRLVSARLGLAECYLSMGLVDAAEAEAEEALRLDPENPDALYWSGQVARAQNKIRDAARMLQEALDSRPIEDRAFLVPYRNIVAALSEARSEPDRAHFDRT